MSIKRLTLDNQGKFSELAMANLPAKRTNLPGSINVFISSGTGSKHGPRIKVSNVRGKVSSTDTFSVSISDEPSVISGKPKGFSSQEFTAIFLWVRLNKDVLLDYWTEKETDTLAVLQKIKPI